MAFYFLLSRKPQLPEPKKKSTERQLLTAYRSSHLGNRNRSLKYYILRERVERLQGMMQTSCLQIYTDFVNFYATIFHCTSFPTSVYPNCNFFNEWRLNQTRTLLTKAETTRTHSCTSWNMRTLVPRHWEVILHSGWCWGVFAQFKEHMGHPHLGHSMLPNSVSSE